MPSSRSSCRCAPTISSAVLAVAASGRAERTDIRVIKKNRQKTAVGHTIPPIGGCMEKSHALGQKFGVAFFEKVNAIFSQGAYPFVLGMSMLLRGAIG